MLPLTASKSVTEDKFPSFVVKEMRAKQNEEEEEEEEEVSLWLLKEATFHIQLRHRHTTADTDTS